MNWFEAITILVLTLMLVVIMQENVRLKYVNSVLTYEIAGMILEDAFRDCTQKYNVTFSFGENGAAEIWLRNETPIENVSEGYVIGLTRFRFVDEVAIFNKEEK